MKNWVIKKWNVKKGEVIKSDDIFGEIELDIAILEFESYTNTSFIKLFPKS